MSTLRLADPIMARDHISYSSLSTYQTCPLRYFFRYVADVPEEIVAASLAFGSAFHAGLEFHFRALLAGDEAPRLDTLLDVFQDAWQSNTEGRTVQFARTDDVNTIGQLADRMFRAFQDSDLANPAGTIIGVEEVLCGELVAGLPDLLARVDLIVETADALEVTDFKTSRSAWSSDHVEDAGDQLLLYSELAKTLSDGRPLRLGFGIVTKTKTPQVELHPIPVDAHQVERTRRIVAQVWHAIQAGHIYPNPSPLNCATCPYRTACRAWAG